MKNLLAALIYRYWFRITLGMEYNVMDIATKIVHQSMAAYHN